LEAKDDSLDWEKQRLEARVGVAMYAPGGFVLPHCIRRGETSIPGKIRRFYTSEFKTIDKYDSDYYEFLPRHAEPRWEAVFIWAMVQMAMQHSWAAWCELKDRRVPMGRFLAALIDELVEIDFKLPGQ
jgi:hypothetical protein